MTTDIEKQYRVHETSIGGHSYRVFEDNHTHLAELYGCFTEYADSELVVFQNQRLSYALVGVRAARLSLTLSNQYDIQVGTRIGIALANSPHWLTAFIAVSAMGATPVLINARTTPADLTYCLESTDCKLWFGDVANPTAVPCLTSTDMDLVAADQNSPALPMIKREPEDEAILIFTSGTTGRPKAAILTHLGVLTALKTIAYSSALITLDMARQYNMDYETIAKLKPSPVTLLIFPLFHVSGCHAVFLSALLQGGKLILMEKWSPTAALQLMQDEKVTAFPGVPTMHWDLLRLEQRQSYDLSSLTSLSVGGQGTPPALLSAIHAAYPQAVIGTGYGMTEANGTVTLAVGNRFLENPRSAGAPISLIDTEIRDDAGSQVSTNSIGEIYVRGSTLMAGYANSDVNPFDENGWFATGDIGYLDADNQLYIVDRRTDMVISGGENIYCAEIEQAIDLHPSVMESAAIGRPDERLGEKLIAVVVPLPGKTISAQEILDLCAEHLAKNKIPKAVLIRTNPLNRIASGKINKRMIRQELEQSDPSSQGAQQ
ncbi:MAG: acyl--CoA ligase, partial [Gammaproteobacteria bacterium]|nr:acyl--CoA ligase [Gammaproteobacteria bacterium]